MIWYFCWTIICKCVFSESLMSGNIFRMLDSPLPHATLFQSQQQTWKFQNHSNMCDMMLTRWSYHWESNAIVVILLAGLSPSPPHPNSELRSRICEGLFTFSLLADPLTSFDIRSSFFSASSSPLLCEISRMLNAAKRPMTTPTVAPASTSTGWWRWSEILEREAKAARRRERSWSQGPRRRDWLEETLLLTYTCDHDGDGYDWEDDDTMTKAAAKHESWAWPEGKDFMESCSFLSSTCDPSNRMSNSSFYLSCTHWDVELNISGGKSIEPSGYLDENVGTMIFMCSLPSILTAIHPLPVRPEKYYLRYFHLGCDCIPASVNKVWSGCWGKRLEGKVHQDVSCEGDPVPEKI